MFLGSRTALLAVVSVVVVLFLVSSSTTTFVRGFALVPLSQQHSRSWTTSPYCGRHIFWSHCANNYICRRNTRGRDCNTRNQRHAAMIVMSALPSSSSSATKTTAVTGDGAATAIAKALATREAAQAAVRAPPGRAHDARDFETFIGTYRVRPKRKSESFADANGQCILVFSEEDEEEEEEGTLSVVVLCCMCPHVVYVLPGGYTCSQL